METHSLHDPMQSAYKKTHSPEAALVKILSDILQTIDSSKCIILESLVEPGIGGASPPVTEPQFTTGDRFRPWLIIAIHILPDARNNRHKPNERLAEQ